MTEVKWWKEAVIYQIYPRSFKDSNGDGIGDLQGIISKIDYLSWLRVDVVWLNPIFASPNDDNGYDISDYYSIMPEFGTMEDFDLLLNQLHEQGIKLIMDLVVNHTSDEHHWFQQAKTSRENPFHNYYHWWPEENGKPPHRESFFDHQGDAWQWNEPTRSWYLHYFSPKQPDLNWENEELRQAIYEMIRWWLKKGVDGFRMDAITFISKDISFPTIEEKTISETYQGEWSHYYARGPRLHEYLKEMRIQVFDHYDAVALAEGPGILAGQALDFVDPGRKELDLFTHFDGMGIGYVAGKFKKIKPGEYDLTTFKKVYSTWSDVFSEKGWATLYLGNHDQPRMVSRWGNDAPEYRVPSSKMLCTFLLTMRATPFIYNGDELGMTNIRFDRIEDYRDLETRNMYQRIKSKDGDVEEFLNDQKETARDNSRTPFQWDGRKGAGFSKAKPWIRINENYKTINEQDAKKDSFSILHFLKSLIQFRHKHRVLVYGEYKLLPGDDHLYVYTRTDEKLKLLIILNFSMQTIDYNPGFYLDQTNEVMVNNYHEVKTSGEILHLSPYQSLIIRCRN